MYTSNFHDPYAKPSLFKCIARSVLLTLQRVLPSKCYAAIYDPLFRIYQWLLRRAYRAKLEKARNAGDPEKVKRMERVWAVMPYSLIGSSGLEHTHDLARDVVQRGIAGAFVECGVAQGGCAALLAMVADSDQAKRPCWFFDSFEGLPDPTTQDFTDGRTGKHIRPLPKGSCLGTCEQVSQLLFENFGLSRHHVKLVKGWFQDTIQATSEEVGPIAILRIDGDWYESTRCCLEMMYDQVSVGGHIIIDDYCSCYGARKATDEFLRRRNMEVALVPDGRGGCSFEKPASKDESTRVLGSRVA